MLNTQHTHTPPPPPPFVSHAHILSVTPPTISPAPCILSLSLTLLTTVTIKTLRKHIHVGGWGVGEGRGWRLQRSYWQKAVINKWVLSLDLNSGRVEEFLRQRVPDRRCKKAEGTLSEHFGVVLWDFQELLTRWVKISCSYAHSLRKITW